MIVSKDLLAALGVLVFEAQEGIRFAENDQLYHGASAGFLRPETQRFWLYYSVRSVAVLADLLQLLCKELSVEGDADAS